MPQPESLVDKLISDLQSDRLKGIAELSGVVCKTPQGFDNQYILFVSPNSLIDDPVKLGEFMDNLFPDSQPPAEIRRPKLGRGDFDIGKLTYLEAAGTRTTSYELTTPNSKILASVGLNLTFKNRLVERLVRSVNINVYPHRSFADQALEYYQGRKKVSSEGWGRQFFEFGIVSQNQINELKRSLKSDSR